MSTGQIVSVVLEKGFGFIKPTDGSGDIFFHNSVLNCSLEAISVGQEVEYELDLEAEKARAKSVKVHGAQALPPGAAERRSFKPRFAPSVKLDCGFITKLIWKKQIGFISADSGGAELLFEPGDVTGDKSFQKLKVGDYVQFVRNKVEPNINLQLNPPTVHSVEAIERVPKRLPRIGLPNNPKARRKKPTWR